MNKRSLLIVMSILLIAAAIVVRWLHITDQRSLTDQAVRLVRAPSIKPNPDVQYYRIADDAVVLTWATKGFNLVGTCYNVTTRQNLDLEHLSKQQETKIGQEMYAVIRAREQVSRYILWTKYGHASNQKPRWYRTLAQLPAVSIVPQRELIDCAFNLKHKTTAYLIQEQYTPWVLTWLHRLLPSVKATPRRRYTLYTGTLTAPMRRIVGSVDRWPGLETGCEPDLQWSPDGKQLNFLYYNTVYSIGVN